MPYIHVMEWKLFGSYLVSNEGKVKRYEKELKLRIINGYNCVNLCENGTPKTYYVHRIVLSLFKGECPNGHECDHIDRNPLNNHIDNLHWVTKYENIMNRSMTRSDILEIDQKKRHMIIQKEYYSKLGYKKQNGCITIINEKYRADIQINKIRYFKTFSTKEEAQAFIESKKNISYTYIWIISKPK